MALNAVAADALPYCEPLYARDDAIESNSDATRCNCNTISRQDSNLYYDMSGNKIFIIFNHYKYNKTRHYKYVPKTREGTFADVETLERTYRSRGFTVITHQDWNYKDIVKYLSDVSNKDHSATSCLAVAVMSHGRGGHVCAADRRYPVQEIIDIVLAAPGLAGKPKLFFIQACRSGHTEPYKTKLLDENLDIPVNSDCFVLYAAYQDFVSFRNVYEGSWMMQALCDVVDTHHAALHLLEMVPIINLIVANKYAIIELTDQPSKVCKQIPVTEFKMNKFLML